MKPLLCKSVIMRTTVDIPDPIFRKMKATAALRGVSVREFLLNAIEQQMA